MSKSYKKIYNDDDMNPVHKYFCDFKTHICYFHKKIIHHVHKRKHHGVSYTHVLLLLILFLLYGTTNFNRAQSVDGILASETPIVIENEPQLIPDQLVPEALTGEILTGEILTGEILSGEILTGEILTGEILIGEILTGEILTGLTETGGFSTGGILTEIILTGEILSGEILTGEILTGLTETGGLLTGLIETGILLPAPEVLTGLISEVFTGIISPDSITGLLLWLDASTYDSLIMSNEKISAWKDKRNNGIEATMSDITRRPTYETDIVSGHPAIYFDDSNDGLGTNITFEAPYTIYTVFNVENPYLANTRVLQGLNDRYLGTLNYRLTHVISGSIVGDGPYVSPDFVIASIRNDGTDAYVSNNGISITQNPMYNKSPTGFGIGSFGFTQDEPLGGYVAEVLVYDNSLPLDERLEILAYLDDKYPNRSSQSSHMYVSPVVIAEPIIDITPLTGEAIITTGQEIIAPAEIITGAVETGIVSPIIEPIVEPVVPEVIIPPVQETPQILAEIVTGEAISPSTGVLEISTGGLLTEEIVTGYFDTAYDKGSYDDKIIQLQKLLTRMQLYTGAGDGVYSDEVIAAVYAYQIENGLLAGQETNKAVRGYLGPKTRKGLNQSYIEYQIYEISLQQQIETGNILSETGNVQIETGGLSTGGLLTEISTGNLLPAPEVLTEIGTLSGINTIDIFTPVQEISPSVGGEQLETGNLLPAPEVLTGLIETGILETETGNLLPAPSNFQIETGTTEIVLPVVEQEALNEIGTLPGVNTIVLFDPLANPLFFSGLLLDTGFQSLLSGFVYTSGAQIGLVFTTGTQQEITAYLKNLGYVTGTMTLVPVNSKTLVGDVALNFADLSGILLVPVVLQSVNELEGHIAEVQIPEGALLKTADGSLFTGEIAPPIFEDPTIVEQYVDQDVLAVIDVGADQHIQFEDTGGNDIYATFRVPVPGMNIGDTIDVNYSEDGINRTYLNSVNVQIIDNESYAVFYANHFTTFYLGTDTGTFLINNDDAYTSSLAVTLNNNVSGAVQMRFGNSIAQRDAASWVAYATGYSWNLTGVGGEGIKRVYSQFSGNGVVRGVSDSIIYDTTSGTIYVGLQAHLNGFASNTRFADIGPHNLIFTGINGASSTIWSGESVMGFDGINQYIENLSGFITGYPFSISAWIKLDRNNVQQGLVMYGDSTVNNIQFGLTMTNAALQLTANGNTIAGSNLVVNKWYHVVGVFASATDRRLYLDTALDASTTNSRAFVTTNPQRRVGRKPGTAVGYLSGFIDEVRVYNKALTTIEIQNIYMIPPTFDTQTAFTGTPTLYGELTPKMRDINLVINGITYHTTADGSGKWKTNPMITGLADGTYTVTLNYTNVYGDTGTATYTSGLIISLPASTGLHITYSPTGWTSGDVIATLTGLDPTYMIINNFGSESYTFTGNGSFIWQYVDKQGTTGYITATVTGIDTTPPTFSGISSGSYYSGNVTLGFADTNLSGATLSGSNGNSYFSGNFQSGSTITGAGTYILTVKDKAGNSAGAIFTIDKTKPTGTVTYVPSSGTRTSGDVVATLSGSESITVTNNGGLLNYVFTGNDSFIFTFQDTAGNTGSTTATVSRIDKISPIFSGVTTGANYITGVNIVFSDNNTGVTATLNGSPYTSGTPITSDNIYIFVVTDTAGNSTGAAFILSTDTTPPTAIVAYSPGSGSRTSGNVVATLTGFSETGVTITNNGGSANYTFTGNGSFVFTFQDAAENTGSLIAAVDWIDRTPPIFTGVITGGIYDYTSSGIIIDFTDDNTGATAILMTYSLSNGVMISSGAYISGTPIIASGHYNYEFIVTDAAGNSTGARFHIHYLTFSVEYTPGSGSLTSGDVLAVLTGFSEPVTDLNSTGYIFTGNGSFLFSFYHPEGLDTHYFTATVYWIDKTLPIIGGVTSGGYYTGATLTFSDANLSGTVVSGLDNAYYSGDFQNGGSIIGDGMYRITVYDTAANSTSATFTIDTVSPTFTGVVTGGTYDDSVIIYFADDNSGVTARVTTYTLGSGSTIVTSGAYISGTPIIASGHYSYIFTVTDIAGNSTGAKFHIHYHPPTATVTYSPGSGSRTSGDVIGTLTGFNTTGITVTNNAGSSTYAFTGNDSFVFQFTDINGHGGSATGTVTWIDKTPPIFTGIVSGGIYFEHPAIYFSDANLSGATLSGINGNAYYSGDFQNGGIAVSDGEYLFTVYDLAGNSTGATYELENSLLGFSGITSGGIYSGVTITYTFTGDFAVDWMSAVIISGLDNGYYSGDFSSGYTEKTWTFNEIGTFSFTMYEADGDSTGAIFTIDPFPPTISGVANGGYYTGVTLAFSEADLSGAILSGLDNAYYSGNFQNGSSIVWDGIYLLTVYDTVGNSTSITFTIDTLPPTFTGIVTGLSYLYYPEIYFSDLNLSGAVVSGTNNSYYSGDYASGSILNEEGRFIFTVYDLAGNSTGASFRVHTSMLGFSGVMTGAYYNHDVAIDYRLYHLDPDDYLSGAVLSGLNGNSYYSGDYQSGALITGEGMYRFIVYEGDGDRTGAIFTIDKTPPTASLRYDPTFDHQTTGEVMAYLSGFSEPIIMINDGTGTERFYNNREFTFGFTDLAGNIGTNTAYVYRIKPVLGALTGVGLSTLNTSYQEIIGGRSTGVVDVSITTGTLYKNGIALSGLTTTGVENDEFYITMMASGDPLTTYISTLTIGDTTGDFIITTMDIPASISGPTAFDFGDRDASDMMQTIEKTFSGSADYFKVVDRQGNDTGYYTTISMSDMINGSGATLPYTAIAVKALTGIMTLSGTENPRVYSAITDTYQYFTASPLTFISRDTAANAGAMGTYGLQTVWRIDIPAFQNRGDYAGVITYTVY